jgi:predicted patatin/cPLA2 family phospholipase
MPRVMGGDSDTHRRAAVRAWATLVAGALVCAAIGCSHSATRRKIVPSPVNVIDRENPVDAMAPLDAEDLKLAAEKVRQSRRPSAPPDRTYNILVLSGGGIYGAYPAGLLCGWTAAGDRPEFDVITGVSTGGLIAAVAFLGPDYDWLLKDLYTTVSNKDIFEYRRPIHAVLSESVADNAPMADRLRGIVCPEFLARTAAEHAKGRRLYIGTTNLGTRRFVVWDMGAIATRGTPEAEKLFEDILLASTAVPGFFPPSHICVDVDGAVYEELHVDGGVSRSMFFRTPYVPPSQREGFGSNSLYNSNLYVVVAGKLYADSDKVRPRPLPMASAAITSLLYSQARGDIDRLFNYSVLTGMHFKLTAIPQDLPTSNQSLKFDPAEMGQLYEIGYQLGANRERPWKDHPPALDVNEELRARTGTKLTISPDQDPKQIVAPPEPTTLIPDPRKPFLPPQLER